MIALLQGKEDQILIGQRADDFQQRIIAATVVHDPQLSIAGAMFPDLQVVDGKSIQRVEGAAAGEEDLVLFPTSEEELAAVLELAEERGFA